MTDDFAIVCGSLGFFFLIFAFIAVMRYLAYRETLALAEKGLVRGQIRGDNKGTLRWGIAITAVGMALCLGLWPIGFFSGTRWPLGIGPWMLAGLLPMFFGLALVLIYYLTAREEKDAAKPPVGGPTEKSLE
ncbi:MAG: DUF6249 domain-containing protein [Anaerolineales bacterium]